MTAEWRHVTARFHGFIANLRPPAERRWAARKAAAEAATCLSQCFHSADGSPPAGVSAAGPGDYVVIGGYGKGTAIRPGRTVDMLYVLPAALRPHGRPQGGAGPPRLIHDLAAVLRARYGAVDGTGDGWIACAGGAAGDGTVVRVIPCFPCAEGGFLIAAPGAGWRHANPLAEAARLRLADRVSANKATHLIVMAKAWRQANGVAMGGLALELLACEFAGLWTYQRRSLLFYDWMVRDFFFWLGLQGRRPLPVPGAMETVHAGDGWLDDAAAAYTTARRACRLERDNRDDDAREHWVDIFGPAFGDAPAAARPDTPLPDAAPWLAPPPLLVPSSEVSPAPS